MQQKRIYTHVSTLGWQIYHWIQDNQHLLLKKPVGPIAAEILLKSKEEATFLQWNVATNLALKSFVVH
jgi:hypothetical protein